MNSRENISNTPDYILADVMLDALESYENATNRNAALATLAVKHDLEIAGAAGKDGVTIRINAHSAATEGANGNVLSFPKEGGDLARLLFDNLPAVTCSVLINTLTRLAQTKGVAGA